MSSKLKTLMLNFKDTLSRLHIGMRKWKSLLAIFISFWVWQLIRLVFPDLEVHPIYMYIYGLIEIRDTSEKTVDFGSRRLKATLSAFLVGLPLLALVDVIKEFMSAEWAFIAIDLLFVMVGVLIVFAVAQKMGCKTFCGIAAIIYIILLVSHSDDGRYVYCLLRAFQTVLAVGIAWLLNVKLFPYHGKEKIEVETNVKT